MCGIAGIINPSPTPFDYTTFCTLGIANDARGGDSCGIFIDGVCEYGTGDKKLFSNFFWESPTLRSTEMATIALLHDRKASVGAVNEANAQPVIICNAENKPEFVLIHNGTISNHDELAKKYIPDFNTLGCTDSQIMAQIFYKHGFGVLDEYIGGAVFVAVDYRTKEVFLFKGKSKSTRYGKIEEERPLFYTFCKESGELVFSSICSFLGALRPYEAVCSLEPNKLFKCSAQGLEVVKEYKRDTKEFFPEPAVPTTYSGSNYYQGSSLYIWGDINTLRYKEQGKFVNGLYYVTQHGRITRTATGSGGSPIWFWKGYWVEGETAYDALDVMFKDNDLETLTLEKQQTIAVYCKNPLYVVNGAIYDISGARFNGDLQMFNSQLLYTIKDGARVSCKYLDKPYVGD